MSPLDGAESHGPSDGLPILVVDLDGTLIRSDMLYETFWAAVSRRWANLVPVLGSLPSGKAGLKRTLADLGPRDADRLPYNSEVLGEIESWRARGGRTALVTASDERIAARIASHLGLFDEVHGSDGVRNLKGHEKARFLTARFGKGGYAYVGDSPADLPVWRNASEAVTVNLAPVHIAKIETANVRHLGGRDGRGLALVRAMRPHQWLKNALVFLPMLAAHQITPLTALHSAVAFVSFSIIASSVYLLNDLLDLDADRVHPRKRDRPFASGAVPLAWGTALCPGLLLLGFAIGAFLGAAFLGVMALYYVCTLMYSLDLKRRDVIDICMLAGLYTLRILAGGAATGIPLSVWLLAFSLFFFFSLAAMKRQTELVSIFADGKSQAQGRGYHTSDLPIIANMAVSSGYVSVLVMALYLNTDAVAALYGDAAPLWGICLVLLFWISRMAMISHRGRMNDDPVVFAARDPVSLVCAGLIGACAVAGAVL